MADRRSPLFDTHVRMGAQMVKGGGDYWFPQAYTSPIEEHVNVRTAVGMQDLTSMGEVDIKGPGAERLRAAHPAAASPGSARREVAAPERDRDRGGERHGDR
mgnify:CR=1 FL=1